MKKQPFTNIFGYPLLLSYCKMNSQLLTLNYFF